MDERSKLIAYKVISIMYFITLLSMVGVVLYRQFALGQDIHEFEDIGFILTFNSLFLISALLYYGAIPVQKIRIKFILMGYGAIIVLGSLFTYAKYNIFQKPGLSLTQLLDKLLIIFLISGIIVIFFVIFSFLGKRKIEKELED